MVFNRFSKITCIFSFQMAMHLRRQIHSFFKIRNNADQKNTFVHDRKGTIRRRHARLRRRPVYFRGTVFSRKQLLDFESFQLNQLKYYLKRVIGQKSCLNSIFVGMLFWFYFLDLLFFQKQFRKRLIFFRLNSLFLSKTVLFLAVYNYLV